MKIVLRGRTGEGGEMGEKEPSNNNTKNNK